MDVPVKDARRSGQLRYVIDDASKVGEDRRTTQTLTTFEFDDDHAGKVAIAATELANNLHLHAGGGELLIQVLGAGDSRCLELLSIDRGPGMADIARCLTDGYSTAGTPGTGLGAVKRLANAFDIHSEPGQGTIVMARFGPGSALRHGAISIPLAGELDCGDSWYIVADGEGTAVLLVDGLGHGTFAAEAAQTCVDAFLRAPGDTPAQILQRANLLMSKTRGGAAACARLQGSSLTYAGVGNISGYLVSAEKSQGLMSHNGTLGMHRRPMQQLDYKIATGAMLVMHSDGLSARWNLKQHPALLQSHPAIIAAVLYRDHARERDDATVVVVAT